MVSRSVLTVLVAAGFVIPVAIAVVMGVGRLLGAMQDAAGAAVLDRVALAIGILWVLDVVCLVLALGINTLGPPTGPPNADS